jgi:predicted NAD/FAD-dependent oxidoreductase
MRVVVVGAGLAGLVVRGAVLSGLAAARQVLE